MFAVFIMASVEETQAFIKKYLTIEDIKCRKYSIEVEALRLMEENYFVAMLETRKLDLYMILLYTWNMYWNKMEKKISW